MSGKMRHYKKRLKEPRTYLMMLLVASSIWFLIQLIIFGVISWKYQVVIAGVVVVVNGIVYDLLFARKRRNKRIYRNTGKILGGVMVLVVCFMAFIMNRADAVIKSMSYKAETEREISLIVLEDSPLTRIEDFGASDITGMQTVLCPESTEAMLGEMETKLKTVPATKECEKFEEMIDALYDGSISAIILDEEYRALAYDVREDFGKTTRVIARVNYRETRKNISKKVAVTARPYLVLFSGIEEYGTIDAVAKPDVFVLAAVNPRMGEILFVHIPADSYMPIKVHNDATEQFKNHRDLLAHSGLFGKECAVWTLEEELGVSINYYVECDFSVMDELAEAVGGVTVEGNTSFDKFWAVLGKLSNPSPWYNYMKIARILKDSVEINFSLDEIKRMIQFQVKERPEWKVRSVTLEGTQQQEESWFYGTEMDAFRPDKHSMEEVTGQIFDILGKSQNVEEGERKTGEELW